MSGVSEEVSNFVDADTMLSYVGDFGRYQKLLLVLFSFINILSAYHYFGQTFISVIPDHRCVKPNNSDYDEISVSQCYVTAKSGPETIRIPCTSWEYNNSYGFVSIVQELDWVCKDDWKPFLGQSVYFAGSVLGSLLFGVIADRIGRLHALVAANMMAFIGNLISIFSYTSTIFAMARFLAGFATDANFVMMYIIVMEYIRPNMRTIGLNLTIGIFYCVSSMSVPWMAVMVQNWKYFLVVVTIPHIFVLFFYCYVPESAQWLISKGKIPEAIDCFKKIARVNGRDIHIEALTGLQNYAEAHIKQEGHESFLGLLKTSKLRRKTMILIFKSMVMTLGYDAIARNVNGFNLSPFWIFTASSATILPGCLFILALQDRIGRKAMASGSLFIAGIFMATMGIILATYGNVNAATTITLIVVARLGTVVAYNSGAQYAVELIPTVVRGQGVSVIHVAGNAATFFSPQILYLAKFWQPLPEVTLGVLLTAGAFACLFLPETLDRRLPVTLEEGEDFGEEEGMFEFSFNKKKTTSTLTLYKDC